MGCANSTYGRDRLAGRLFSLHSGGGGVQVCIDLGKRGNGCQDVSGVTPGCRHISGERGHKGHCILADPCGECGDDVGVDLLADSVDVGQVGLNFCERHCYSPFDLFTASAVA